MDSDKKSEKSPSTDEKEPQSIPDQSKADDAEAPLILKEEASVEAAEDPGAASEADQEQGAEPEAEQTVAPEQPYAPAAPPERNSGGFGAALLGGVLAAALGFVVARTEILDPFLPASWQAADASDLIEPLNTAIQTQSDRIDGLEGRIAAIPQPDLGPLETAVSALEAGIGSVDERAKTVQSGFADLEARLTALEKRPVTESVSPEAIAAYENELTRLRDAVAAQRGEVEALLDEARAHDQSAAEAARRAAAQTALARLRVALEAGAPFAAAAEELAANGVSLPENVAAVSAEGVATMASLRAGFAPAARGALASARSGGQEGLGAFLQRQLGARSVEPREGDDADAVLSRAEAALTGGDLATALSEIGKLPEAAQPALAEWAASAQRRHEAIQAAAALADTLANE